MTRERAIRILKGDTLYNSRELEEAKEMAIRALEVDEAYQLEYEKTTPDVNINPDECIDSCIDKAEDCISRESVLELIYDYKEKYSENRKEYPINYGTLLAMCRWVRELPSVHSQNDKLEKIKQIIGDWNDFIEGKKNGYGANVYMRRIKEVIHEN